MGALKTKFLRKKADLSVQREVWLKNPSQIKKILLISNSDSKSLKRKVEEVFASAGVHHLFHREIKEDTTVGFYYSVHKADFGLTGGLKNEKLQNLTKMDFDLLIDLSQESALLPYFVNQSKSTLKVGGLNSKRVLAYDVLVDFMGNDSDKINNIYNHLNLLKQDAKI